MQFFVLGWDNNHSNIVKLRDTALTLYAELEKAEEQLAGDLVDSSIERLV